MHRVRISVSLAVLVTPQSSVVQAAGRSTISAQQGKRMQRRVTQTIVVAKAFPHLREVADVHLIRDGTGKLNDNVWAVTAITV